MRLDWSWKASRVPGEWKEASADNEARRIHAKWQALPVDPMTLSSERSTGPGVRPGMTYSYFPPGVLPEGFRITHGTNDLIFAEDGTRYIDLLSGSGTVFLGHATPAITRRVQEELGRLWSAGAVPTLARDEAFSAV